MLVGQEVIGRSNCWRIDATGFASQKGRALKLTVHLDPAHDYLPTKIAVWYEEAPFERNHQVWKMTEFMRVLDRADRRERWFPRLATLSQPGGTLVLNLSAITINERIAKEQFRIDAPEGTLVR